MLPSPVFFCAHIQINVHASDIGLQDASSLFPMSDPLDVDGVNSQVPNSRSGRHVRLDTEGQVLVTLKVARVSVLEAAEKKFGLRRAVAQVRTD